jgi:hypothetical protein
MKTSPRIGYSTNKDIQRVQRRVLEGYLRLLSIPCSGEKESIEAWLEQKNIKGIIDDCGQCAIAEFIRSYFIRVNPEWRSRLWISVDLEWINVELDETALVMRLPVPVGSSLQEFIQDFDSGAFPALVEREEGADE